MGEPLKNYQRKPAESPAMKWDFRNNYRVVVSNTWHFPEGVFLPDEIWLRFFWNWRWWSSPCNRKGRSLLEILECSIKRKFRCIESDGTQWDTAPILFKGETNEWNTILFIIGTILDSPVYFFMLLWTGYLRREWPRRCHSCSQRFSLWLLCMCLNFDGNINNLYSCIESANEAAMKKKRPVWGLQRIIWWFGRKSFRW